VTALYLVRHGQSAWNAARLTQGQTPHPELTELGRRQARTAAEAIAAQVSGAVVIISSDLRRAVQTADEIAAVLNVPVRLDARLREQSLGTLEGLPYERSWALAGEHDWSDPGLPVAGGESWAQLTSRVGAALAEVDLAVPTVLVSHGDAIRAMLGVLTSGQSDGFGLPTGSVTRVAADGMITRLA
jgi:probable phosphoglycerate mutase